MVDLTNRYMGLTLRTPLVPSACAPLSELVDNIKRLEACGAAAVVLHSLFAEQLHQEHSEVRQAVSNGQGRYAPNPEDFHIDPDLYLRHIRSAKEAVQIPIIASLNGSTLGSWVSYAQEIEQAGADALELNIYAVPTNPTQTGAEIEAEYLEIVRAVKNAVQIPVALKLSPFFTNLSHMAQQLDSTGLDALVLFNRFYQPDINLTTLTVEPHVQLSNSEDIRLPLRWIAILFGRLQADLAATGGIHSGEDVLKLILAGAKVTMLCSVLLQKGMEQIRTIEAELTRALEERGFTSVQAIQGNLSQNHIPNPGTFERAQYIQALQSYKPEWIKRYGASAYFG